MARPNMNDKSLWIGRTGVTLIDNERSAQKKKWGDDHDDDHDDRSLSYAAVCFAAPQPLYVLANDHPEYMTFTDPWPEGWDSQYDKRPRYSNGARLLIPAAGVQIPRRLRQLQVAGALIAAEMDRLIRRLDSGEMGDAE